MSRLEAIVDEHLDGDGCVYDASGSQRSFDDQSVMSGALPVTDAPPKCPQGSVSDERRRHLEEIHSQFSSDLRCVYDRSTAKKTEPAIPETIQAGVQKTSTTPSSPPIRKSSRLTLRKSTPARQAKTVKHVASPIPVKGPRPPAHTDRYVRRDDQSFTTAPAESPNPTSTPPSIKSNEAGGSGMKCQADRKLTKPRPSTQGVAAVEEDSAKSFPAEKSTKRSSEKISSLEKERKLPAQVTPIPAPQPWRLFESATSISQPIQCQRSESLKMLSAEPCPPVESPLTCSAQSHVSVTERSVNNATNSSESTSLTTVTRASSQGNKRKYVETAEGKQKEKLGDENRSPKKKNKRRSRGARSTSQQKDTEKAANLALLPAGASEHGCSFIRGDTPSTGDNSSKRTLNLQQQLALDQQMLKREAVRWRQSMGF